VWLNPPYGRGIGHWLHYAYEQSCDPSTEVVVVLVPSCTDTGWWHEFVQPLADEIRLVQGRVSFDLAWASNGATGNPQFGSVVVVYRGLVRYEPRWGTMGRGK